MDMLLPLHLPKKRSALPTFAEIVAAMREMRADAIAKKTKLAGLIEVSGG